MFSEDVPPLTKDKKTCGLGKIRSQNIPGVMMSMVPLIDTWKNVVGVITETYFLLRVDDSERI